MKEAPGSSETSVLTRATRRNNPEDTILHNLTVFVGAERIIASERDEITRDWRGLHSDGL
jgi:hypothetical protein